jgi:hypothetical protein
MEQLPEEEKLIIGKCMYARQHVLHEWQNRDDPKDKTYDELDKMKRLATKLGVTIQP